MPLILFTANADLVDLNAYDLDQLEADGTVVNNAFGGNDVVTLSFTQNLGEFFDAGNGRDVVYGSQVGDRVEGGLGKDDIYGQDGDDNLSGGNDVDKLYGGNGGDLLNGNDDRDYLYGDGGDDDLYGGKGGDFLYGGSGQDELLGGDHFDFLYGEDGNDVVSGNVGDDLLSGGGGSDSLYGGRGRDQFLLAGADLNDSYDRVIDFEVDLDTIGLQGVRTVAGTDITDFATLDSNGDGVLNGSDSNVSIVSGALTLDLEGGTIALARVTALGAANFDFLVA